MGRVLKVDGVETNRVSVNPSIHHLGFIKWQVNKLDRSKEASSARCGKSKPIVVEAIGLQMSNDHGP